MGQASDHQTHSVYCRTAFIFSVVKFLFLLKLDKIVSLTQIFESVDLKRRPLKTTGKYLIP